MLGLQALAKEAEKDEDKQQQKSKREQKRMCNNNK